jgi:aspartyl-tRNA(Asn)/glutamyl-tRNA(Gln) amidotransferase subunit A
VPTDRTVQSAESYAYHAEYVARTPELYQAQTLPRIQAGAEISAADYIHGRRELEKARREIAKVFENADVFITPTTPVPPPTIAELKENPDQLRPAEILLLRNTRPVNVWGLPAISVPCGFTSGGLPIGLQIVGPHWGEALILQIAQSYEQATDWHERRPGLRI